ncbi:cytochrome c-type biogenesis protein CcmH [Methylobacterium sp. WL9]|nr:cytochrome c-type biogenesis protein CcmH [Methylobacterium sp. WL9]
MTLFGVFRRANPPSPAGEGGPCVSRGGVRGAPSSETSLPSPDPLRGPPSPAEGRGFVRAIVFALLLIVSAGPTHAVQPDEVLKDPVLESRARHISEGLRCLVCQNQSIDDSDAPLAKDLRVIVRERLTAGDSNGQVVDYLVARYGEFVLLRPVFGWHTLLLWLTPLLAVLLGGFGIWRLSRRRAPKAAGLSQAEQAEVEALLERR